MDFEKLCEYVMSISCEILLRVSLSVVLLPLFSYNKSHAWSLHDWYVLRYPVRAIVLLLRHYTSNSKRNHSFGTNGVLDINNTIFLGF